MDGPVLTGILSGRDLRRPAALLAIAEGAGA